MLHQEIQLQPDIFRQNDLYSVNTYAFCTSEIPMMLSVIRMQPELFMKQHVKNSALIQCNLMFIDRNRQNLPRFPVLKSDDRIVWSDEESEILNSKLPILIVESVYVTREKLTAAQKWLAKKRESMLDVSMEEDI